MRSFYDILGVEDTASVEIIKQAYFDYLRKVHPDKQTEEADPELVAQGKLIWNTLKEQNSRLQYDNWIREQKLRALKGTIVEQIEIDAEEDSIEEQCRCGDFYQVSPEEIKQIVDVGVFECGSCSLCLEVLKTQ